MQRFARRQPTLAGVSPNNHPVAFLFNIAAAAALVAPIPVRPGFLQVGQVPAILEVLELAAQAHIHVPDPELVIRASGVPLPLPRCRSVAALAAHPHHVNRPVAPERNFQADVLKFSGLGCAQRQFEIGIAIAFQLSRAFQFQISGSAPSLPPDRAAALACNPARVVGPIQPSERCLYHQGHRRGEQFLLGRIHRVDVSRERADNAVQQAGAVETHFPPQNCDCPVLQGHGCIGRENLIIQPDRRVQPAQA